MRRLEEAQRTSATELNLSKLGLGPNLPSDWAGWVVLGRLDGLRRLNLSENQITAIPDHGWDAIGKLAGLFWLDLSGNGMTALPEAAWEAVGRLARLEYLYLSGNPIAAISDEGWRALGKLTNLSSLFLSQLESWEALRRLVNLRELALTSVKIGEMPPEGWQALSRLTKLKFLTLVDNGLRDVPPEGWSALGRLTDLTILCLSWAGTTGIPARGWQALGELLKIESLALWGHGIGDIPTEGWRAIGRMTNLRELRLGGNEIATVPSEGWETLSGLANLELLDLSRNQITEIPLQAWGAPGRFPKLMGLNLSANPLPEEVLAAAGRGLKSLLEYFEAAQLRAAHPRTVKLMLLGEPASGKSTLVEALAGNPEPCDPKRPETVGVNVRRIEKISPADGRSLYLATWDFAGQHMEYATHQFFLKAGGVYLILWKSRLGSDYGQRDLWYWLELLKMRVRDPEFLLVTTHTRGTPSTLDVSEVQTAFPGFKGHFEVELSDGTGVKELEAKILELAAASPSMKAVWPAPWLAVRDAIRDVRDGRPYVTAEELWRLCAEQEVTEAQTQRDLADQLDKLGEIVYYANPPLSRFVILNPSWLTELVAKVVRDKPVRDRRGILGPADLDRIWGDCLGRCEITWRTSWMSTTWSIGCRPTRIRRPRSSWRTCRPRPTR